MFCKKGAPITWLHYYSLPCTQGIHSGVTNISTFALFVSRVEIPGLTTQGL